MIARTSFHRHKHKSIFCEVCNEEIIHLQDVLHSFRDGFKRMCKNCWDLYDSDKLNNRDWAIRKFTKEMVDGFERKGRKMSDNELIEKQIAELKAQIPQWLPIESAPRDKLILLSGGRTSEDDYENEGVPITRPVTGQWEGLVDEYDDETETFIQNNVWKMAFWDGAWRTVYINPTHYMPLPTLPENEECE